VRFALWLVAGYTLLVVAAWWFQDRLAFPAPRAPLPDPQTTVGRGERIELTMKDGTRLVGWYLPPPRPSQPPPSSPALLWFYGNGETIAAIWPVLRDFQPPDAALLVVDYPGYGGSGGRATESRVYEAADIAYEALASRPGVDPRRIFVYGRSVGTAPATWVAARHPVVGLILEAPFTTARALARRHYPIIPRFVLHLELDNLARMKDLRCPVLVFHGTADRLVPPEMGRQVAAAAAGPVELVMIEGAGHNDTYDLGGRAYREKVWEFVGGP
jgi:fermentation-respiration switch protein FrsA (DUF1100 family)